MWGDVFSFDWYGTHETTGTPPLSMNRAAPVMPAGLCRNAGMKARRSGLHAAMSHRDAMTFTFTWHRTGIRP